MGWFFLGFPQFGGKYREGDRYLTKRHPGIRPAITVSTAVRRPGFAHTGANTSEHFTIGIMAVVVTPQRVRSQPNHSRSEAQDGQLAHSEHLYRIKVY